MRPSFLVPLLVAILGVFGSAYADEKPVPPDDDPCVVALTKLHGALKKYVDTMGEMPKDLGELVVLGLVEDRKDLLSPRSIPARAPSELVADHTTWRIASPKLEGWILVSDDVRDRTVYALHADGRVRRFLAPFNFWYGHWKVPEKIKHARGDENGRLVEGLELVLQEVPTTVARPAVIIRGYRRDDAISRELKSEDRLLNVGGHQVTTLAELEEYVRSRPEVPWTKVPIQVFRTTSAGKEVLEVGLETPVGRYPMVPKSLYPDQSSASGAVSERSPEGGHDPTRPGGTPNPALFTAVSEGDLDEIRKLLREGADPDTRDKRGFTPLILAVFWGRIDVIDELVAAGADINAVGARNETPLLASVDGNHLDLFRRLLEHGAKMEYRDDQGGTILAAACLNGNLEIIQAVLEAGVDINVRHCYREGVRVDATPLMIAGSMGRTAVVEHLLGAGADVSIVGQEGWTALMIAAAEGEKKIVSLFITAGADPNRKSDAGQTALDLAREMKRKAVIEILEPLTDD